MHACLNSVADQSSQLSHSLLNTWMEGGPWCLSGRCVCVCVCMCVRAPECVRGSKPKQCSPCTVVERRASEGDIQAHGHCAVHMHFGHGRRAETDPAKGPKSPAANQSREMKRKKMRSLYVMFGCVGSSSFGKTILGECSPKVSSHARLFASL